MAVKRRLPAGSQSTTSSGEVTPVTSIVTALEDSAELWSAENELKLLQALMTYKPTGIAKNFQMALLLNKISEGKYICLVFVLWTADKINCFFMIHPNIFNFK